MRSRLTASRLLLILFTGLLAGVALPDAAPAAPGPAWEVSSVAQPTNFSVEDNGKCGAGLICDRYLVTLTNMGADPTNGSPIVITDTVPPHLAPVRLSVRNIEAEEG